LKGDMQVLRKISFRTKVIVFIIASIIGIGIVVSVGLENRRIAKNLEIIRSEELKNAQKEEARRSEEELKKKQEEEKKKKEEKAAKQEQQMALEEKYQKSYNAFFSKKYSEAIKLADEILKEDEKFYKAYNVKGIAQCYTGKYLDGMKNIDKALELKPEYGYARFNKALALELYEKLDEALVWYDKALEIENYVWSHYGKASIYGKKGDVNNTVKNLTAAIEIDEAIKEEAKKEKDFDKVRNSKEFQELVK
jgi:tetratricopeptide (TPR) repeat protein